MREVRPFQEKHQRKSRRREKMSFPDWNDCYSWTQLDYSIQFKTASKETPFNFSIQI